MAIGLIAGLALEARIARPLGVAIAIGGGTAEGAERAAEQLAAGGVAALLSFGLAGGLDPRLRPGDWIVPRVVHAAGQDWPTDPELSDLLGGVTVEVLLGETRVVTGATAKRRLWLTTHAAAVDLESGAAARAAERYGLRFAALRAISDPAERSLPGAALAAIDRAGRVRLLRLAAALVGHPLQAPALLALGRDANLARRTLALRVKAIGALGPSPVLGDNNR